MTIFEGESVTIAAYGKDDYKWSTGVRTRRITLIPLKTKIYIITAYRNDCEDVDTIQVTLNKTISTYLLQKLIPEKIKASP